MKWLLCAFGLLWSLHTFAQVEDLNDAQDGLEYFCDVVKMDIDNNQLHFEGNVSFKSDIIEFKNADKIVFDQTTKELTVTGLDEFVIDGAIQIKDKGEKKVLRYTIGERIAYVE